MQSVYIEYAYYVYIYAVLLHLVYSYASLQLSARASAVLLFYSPISSTMQDFHIMGLLGCRRRRIYLLLLLNEPNIKSGSGSGIFTSDSHSEFGQINTK